MKTKAFFLSFNLLFFMLTLNAQTLTSLQQQNARATGYAIVAAKNPGKDFSIYMVKWDGINSLEYNANTQINSNWHAQAAVKGNFFDQPFDGNDFARYSSVVTSQSEFDTYKSAGTDWWIVCSNLPSFSNSSVSFANNGNIGIGTSNPLQKFVVSNNNAEGFEVYLDQPSETVGLQIYNRKTFQYNKMVFAASQYSFEYGNVGIGTTSPKNKLDVKGTIHSQEVKVDMQGWSDFVFKKEYELPTLDEVEKHIKENGHLKDIPNEKEVLENGINLGQMNAKLLQKIEEMTLYMIEQNKRLNSLEKENIEMKTKLSSLQK